MCFTVPFYEKSNIFKKFSEFMNRNTRQSVISEISLNQTKDASFNLWVDLGFLFIDFWRSKFHPMTFF